MKLPIGQGFKLRIRSYFSFSRSPYTLPVPRPPCPCSQFLVLVTPDAIESIVVLSSPLGVRVACMQALHLRMESEAGHERTRENDPRTRASFRVLLSRDFSRLPHGEPARGLAVWTDCQLCPSTPQVFVYSYNRPFMRNA